MADFKARSDCSGPALSISYMQVMAHGHESSTAPAAHCRITDWQGSTDEVLSTGPWLLDMSFSKQ